VSELALAATDVTVRFGGVTALDEITFEVERGEVVGLIGPNGAGKSTMLDALTGFVKPVSGRVTLGERDISRMAPWRRARLGIGRTFQSAELFDELTVRENLEVTGAADDRIADLTGQLDIEPFAGLLAGDLPAGVSRLVSIARTMAYEPSVMLLDEPGAGLMPTEKDNLADALLALRQEHDLSVVLVDHDMSFIGRACSNLVVLDFGKKIASGTPAEIRDSKVVQDAYLGQ
jgi:branched-chain amino acid transport system ATP-binding protein